MAQTFVDFQRPAFEQLMGQRCTVRKGHDLIVVAMHHQRRDTVCGEQRFYDEFAPSLSHGDKTILAIQHWLAADTGAACSVDALVKRAGLGARTFLRRFVKATGMKPSEYQQRLRIARSRELLEFTRDTVEQVAVAVGYEDTSGFRRTFKRVIGLSPAEYRRRFQHRRTSATAESYRPPRVPSLRRAE